MSSTSFSSEGEEAEETPTSSIGPPRKKIKHVDSKYQSEWSHKYGMKHSSNLLILPHSTADPERLFSIIGKVDTSQRSNLHPQTVCDILNVKINVDEECYKSNDLFTQDLLYQAKTATKRCLINSDT